MSDHRPAPSGLTLSIVARLLPLFALSVGCFHFGRLPARELYRISLPESAMVDSSTAPGSGVPATALAGTLGIAQYATPGVYGDPLIVFRIDDTQYGSYPSREWAVPLSDQLGVLTERVLARVPLTAPRAVFDPPSRRAQTYIWRGTVREFEEVDRGSAVLAAVRIDVRIARADDDSIVWSGSSRLERAAEPSNMPGIVQTLSALADEVLTDLATRARRDLLAKRP